MATPDLSEFDALGKRDQRQRCQVAVAREKITGDDLVNLDAALAKTKQEIKAGAVRTWFERRGYSVSLPAIVNHRDGRCTCADE